MAGVSGAYFKQGKYYVLLAFGDLKTKYTNKSGFRLGITTMVSDTANGPFRPAPENLRLLVGNASYFLRFVDVDDDVLVNHHSWEVAPDKPMGVDPSRVYMAPLKKARWDDKGTLRLSWWEGNEVAKAERVPLGSQLSETVFDQQETLILEGVMSLSSVPAGLYLYGSGDRGTGFLVDKSGLVEYGDVNCDGGGFEKKDDVDRKLTFGDKAHFRLIRKERLTEFYLNDYLMQCYSLPEPGTGRVAFIGPTSDFRELKAWYCA